MKVKLDHINLTVSQLERSVNWYEEVFGFQLVQEGIYGKEQQTRWAIVSYKDFMICMHELKGRKNSGENKQETFHKIYHFGIRVSNLKIWKKKIKLFDLKPVVVDYPYSQSYYIDDPDGHEIEVSWTKASSLYFPPFKEKLLKKRKNFTNLI